MVNHYEVATTLADRAHEDVKALAVEYAKPVKPLVHYEDKPVPGPAPEYRDLEKVNKLQGRVGRIIKRAEVHALLAIAQRLDDLSVKL